MRAVHLHAHADATRTCNAVLYDLRARSNQASLTPYPTGVHHVGSGDWRQELPESVTLGQRLDKDHLVAAGAVSGTVAAVARWFQLGVQLRWLPPRLR